MIFISNLGHIFGRPYQNTLLPNKRRKERQELVPHTIRRVHRA